MGGKKEISRRKKIKQNGQKDGKLRRQSSRRAPKLRLPYKYRLHLSLRLSPMWPMSLAPLRRRVHARNLPSISPPSFGSLRRSRSRRRGIDSNPFGSDPNPPFFCLFLGVRSEPVILFFLIVFSFFGYFFRLDFCRLLIATSMALTNLYIKESRTSYFLVICFLLVFI